MTATIAAAIALFYARGVVAIAIVGSALWAVRSPVMPLADALALDRLGVDRRDAYGTVRLWMSATFAVGAIVWGGAPARRDRPLRRRLRDPHRPRCVARPLRLPRPLAHAAANVEG
jgi:hypothetical protein